MFFLENACKTAPCRYNRVGTPKPKRKVGRDRALYNMKEILLDAQKRAYGVGYFNAVNLEMIRAYIEAAEELDSPIIIGTAEALLPIAPFEWIVPAML